jgi:hypothetical protein
MLLPLVIILVIQQLLNVKEIREVVERNCEFNLDWKLVIAGKACPFGHKKIQRGEDEDIKKKEDLLDIQGQEIIASA